MVADLRLYICRLFNSIHSFLFWKNKIDLLLNILLYLFKLFEL